MQWLFLAINLIYKHFCRATWGRAVIGCGYGAPQPITALHQVAIYSLYTIKTSCCSVMNLLAVTTKNIYGCGAKMGFVFNFHRKGEIR